MSSNQHREEIDRFLRLAKINFNSIPLLEQALLHRSYLNEHAHDGLSSNEELEFLGDAVLGMLITEKLFFLAQQQGMAVGRIAKAKSWIVSEEVLADCAEKLELPSCLLLSCGETGKRQRRRLLADSFEAVVGAYYLDSSLQQVREFVQRLFAPYIELSLSNEHCFDYKSLLQSYVQQQFQQLPEYRLVSVDGPEHQQSFVMEVLFDQQPQGRAAGASKKEAEKNAARLVCTRLDLC